MEQLINPGKWTIEELDRIINEASEIKEAGKRIEFLSRIFLNVSYEGSTLIGNLTTPEVFVINLEKVDCFTLIDYVEAMRLSSSISGFTENLRRIRYHSGNVSYESRNHFFTDWIENNSEFVEDITDLIGEYRTIHIIKKLNCKKDGTYIIQGIKSIEREIKYIPASAIDEVVTERLMTGDYVGIYSDEEGLDVSHVGIIIRTEDIIYIRHASSRSNARKVIDEDFMGYIANKPGVIILRPNQISSQEGGL